jgi:hypothetical protein
LCLQSREISEIFFLPLGAGRVRTAIGLRAAGFRASLKSPKNYWPGRFCRMHVAATFQRGTFRLRL